MSRDFIGSKISIITKSQIRYSGTIIGIDAQTSSIILGNVKSFGTENRPGHLTNGHTAGTVLPIMQFANSDIEDLKIVDEEQTSTNSQQQQQYPISSVASPPLPPPQPLLSSSSNQQASIHDDPAIVSAVVSSINKDNNTSNATASSRLIHSLQQMSLNDEQSKTNQSSIRSNSGELGPSWSLLSSSKLGQNNSKILSQQDSGNKSKFFDDFISDKNNNNNINQNQFNRSNQRSSNTHSTQTSRQNGNDNQYDEHNLPIRQPFFSNDDPYPQRQHQHQQQQYQQQNRYQNGYGKHQQNRYQNDNGQQNRYQNGNGQQNQQRYFHNNRRPPMSNQNRRPGGVGGGNRETFQDNPNDYDADFDFETSNLKFNKLTSEDELKNPIDLTIPSKFDIESPSDHSILYDKKKSFFDNLALKEPSDGPTSHGYNRSKNTDTFGNDGGYQRQNNRSNGYGQRRSNNNNYRQQQYGNDDYHYRQHNNNGYHYRY